MSKKKKKYLHPAKVPIYPFSLRQLAKDVGHMRYDAIQLFLEELSKDMIRQSEADMRRGRPKLQDCGMEMAHHLMRASIAAQKAQDISLPYLDMSEDLE